MGRSVLSANLETARPFRSCCLSPATVSAVVPSAETVAGANPPHYVRLPPSISPMNWQTSGARMRPCKRGVGIIELSEVDSLNHSEVARIKAFMSRTTDRFRPPYGMRLVESPRQCVFAGTVNHSAYL